MLKSTIIWADEINRQRSNSNPISVSPRPDNNVAAPLEPVLSKSERKRIERWRNTEIDTWLRRERIKELNSQEGIFEMEGL